MQRARAQAQAAAANSQADSAKNEATNAESARTLALLQAWLASEKAASAQALAATAQNSADEASTQAADARTAAASAQSEAARTRADNQINQLLGGALVAAPSQLDLSLLLTDAATEVPGADAGSHDTASAALERQIGTNSQVQRFYQFLEHQGPPILGKVAVSPDGKYVAAVDDNLSIETGAAIAHLYVWNARDSESRAVEISAGLSCVSDLQWDASDELITTENPRSADGLGGCTTPTQIPSTAECQYGAPGSSGSPYLETRVRIWDIASHVATDPTTFFSTVPLPAISAVGTNPVELSPDGKSIVIPFYTGLCYADQGIELPITDTLIDNLSSGQIEIVPATPNALLYGQPSLTRNGQFFVGYDEYQQRGAVYDLAVSAPNEQCVTNRSECFKENSPTTSQFISMAPDGTAFATGVGTSSVQVFSTASGQPISTPVAIAVPLQSAVWAIDHDSSNESFDLLAVATGSGAVDLINWSTGIQQPVPVEQSADDCGHYPLFSYSADLLYVQHAACSGGSLYEATNVYSVQGGQSVFRGSMSGHVTSSSMDDSRIVAQSISASDTAGLGVIHSFEIWDFSRGAASLVGNETDEEAIASADGLTIVGFHPYDPINDTKEPVQVWAGGAETLPGSTGVLDVAIQSDDQGIVGVGEVGAAVGWNVQPAVSLLYGDTSGDCSTPSSAGNAHFESALGPDGTIRAVTRDGHSIDLESVGPGSKTLEEFDVQPFLGHGEEISPQGMHFSKGAGIDLVMDIDAADPQSSGCESGAAAPGVMGTLVAQIRDTTGNLIKVPIVTSFTRGDGLLQYVGSSGDGRRLLFEALGQVQQPGTLVTLDARSLLPVAAPFNPNDLPSDPLAQAESCGPNLYRLNQDGTKIAGVSSSGLAEIWSDDGRVEVPHEDLDPGPIGTPNGDCLANVAFSPDGNLLAVRTKDGQLLMYNIESFRGRLVPIAVALPSDAGLNLAFSPDSQLIAADGAYVFDATTLQELTPRLRPISWSDPVEDKYTSAMEFVTPPDGELLLDIQRFDGSTAVSWTINLDPNYAGGSLQDLQNRACVIAGRNFTRSEFAQFGLGANYGPTPCSSRAAETP